MKKAIVMITVCLLASSVLQAQTWSEWFRQKKTQINYLGEQIVALKVYGDYVGKGYSIARHGLTDIGDTKEGDLTMRSGYFTSLQNVSPVVKDYWKVAAIGSLQGKIIQVYHKQYKEVRRPNQFTPNEIIYTDKVFASVLADCGSLLDQLLKLTTNNITDMKDDERLNGIDRIYTEMQEVYTFIKNFGSQTSVLERQRMKEANDVKTSRSLFNIQ